MLKEFKEFATRGSVVDLALAVVLGGAFGKIVSSFVGDILMPPIGLVLGKVDFSNLYINLSGGKFTSLAEAKKAGAATLNYGAFFNQIVDFLIIAFAMFLVVKGFNRMKRSQSTTTKSCPFCLTAIPIPANRCSGCTSELNLV